MPGRFQGAGLVMITSAETIEEGARLEADLCIVGAGAAGIAMALQFASTGHRVILLEGGLERADKDAQSLYEGHVADAALHPPANTYRQRRFGGTTTNWGGRCMPFDPIDFERRPWIAGSGWPIGYDDVARHYPEANALCEAGDYIYDAKKVDGGMRAMVDGFAPAHFNLDAIERFSCPTDFGARYGQRLKSSKAIEVVLGANAIELVTSDTAALSARSPSPRSADRRFAVKATRVVLATGGLEVPRLLLASRRHHVAGIGNAGDQVGRSYMCHIAGTYGTLVFDAPLSDIWHGYEISRGRDLLPPPPGADIRGAGRHAAGNIVMRLHHPRIPDPAHRTGALSAIYLAKPFIGYEYAKRLHGEESSAGATISPT